MRRECKNTTRCKRCFLEGCPFGRNGEPSEDEYPTAKDRCKYYEPKEAFKISELKAYTYDDMIDGKADIDVKYYTKEDADTAIATLQGANDEKAERIVELQKQVDELDGVKKSAEQILQNLLDCGLIKEWYFNGMFNAVLKNDDPHLQIAELKQKLEDVNELIKTARKMLEDAKATAYAESVDAGMANKKLQDELTKLKAQMPEYKKFIEEEEFRKKLIDEYAGYVYEWAGHRYVATPYINMFIKGLLRTLYKALANWAKSERYTEATWHGDEHREELWAKVQDKCLKKAEEYK